MFVFSVELPSDRNDMYLNALKENISRSTQMVLCVVPTNKKDRYDAIKKTCCLDHPGLFFGFFSHLYNYFTGFKNV